MTGMDLDDLLVAVQERSGVDFRLYRRDAIERRLRLRMRAASVATYAAYRGLIEEDPREVERLISHLTIKFSHFFRNPEVIDLLRERAFPELVRPDAETPLAVWCAGCGRGEEAYTLAILLEESMRANPRAPGLVDASILATDIDPQALEFARNGLYGDSAVAGVPPALLERYLTPHGEKMTQHMVQDVLRHRIQWLRHDLTAGSPPREGRYHLISCRNVVIYLDRPAQECVQHLLTTNIVPGGYLCLGEAEALLPSVRQAYDVVDHRARIFRRKD